MTKRRTSLQTRSVKKQRSVAANAVAKDRLDPQKRGIHPDAIQAEISPSNRATCVDCNQVISKGVPRWGIKYAGNPLTQPVLPLYGSHPMVMWCHTGGCGLSFTRLKSDLPPAARTCHYCTDVPDHDGLRLHCGGSTKGMKIRRHAFHVACWKDAIRKSNLDDVARRAILVHPREFLSHCGLSFDAISPEEQEYVLQRWNDDSTTP